MKNGQVSALRFDELDVMRWNGSGDDNAVDAVEVFRAMADGDAGALVSHADGQSRLSNVGPRNPESHAERNSGHRRDANAADAKKVKRRTGSDGIHNAPERMRA